MDYAPGQRTSSLAEENRFFSVGEVRGKFRRSSSKMRIGDRKKSVARGKGKMCPKARGNILCGMPNKGMG